MKISTLICRMDGTQELVWQDAPENWPAPEETEEESPPQKEETEEK